MERSAQPHDVKDSVTATRDRSGTEGAPPPLHPHFTNNLPHPGYSGDSDGTPPDPDASYENDVPGPIPLEPRRPHVAGQTDGAFDIDWFSVELDAGRTYVFHVRGEATVDSTLDAPAFAGLWFDPDGDGANLQPVSGYRQLDSGHGTNAVLTVTPTQSGTYCFAAFAQDWSLLPPEEFADPGTPYVPWEEFADPGTPYAPPEEFADPGTPYVPPEEFADPGTPYAPPEEFGEAHGNPVDSGNPGIPGFLLAWVNLHAEPAEADAM